MAKKNSDDPIERIKRQAIKAVYSDDELMDRLVLKGGNFLDLILGISTRSSKDLDFSMDGEFSSPEELQIKLARCLTDAFQEIEYEVFDLKVTLEPPRVSEDRKHFWGGYRVYFKLIQSSSNSQSEEAKRRSAIPLSPDGSTRFRIDISKHEFCEDRRQHLLDGYSIYAYSPELFIAEKLRAICQQHQRYTAMMQRHRSARARDFIDICCVIDQVGVNTNSDSFRKMTANVFAKKNVPLDLLALISDDREFHRQDFISVQATVKPGVRLYEFDHYFDRIVELAATLESTRHM